MVIRELQLMQLMSCDFRENRYGDSLTLLMGTNELYSYLRQFSFRFYKNSVQNFSEQDLD